MKKLNAQKLIFLILMMMSLNVLLTDTYPVMNKTLALFGIVLTVLAFTKTKKHTQAWLRSKSSQTQNVIKTRFIELDQLKNVKFTKLMLTKKALSLQRVRIALFTCHKMDYVKLLHINFFRHMITITIVCIPFYNIISKKISNFFYATFMYT